MQCTAPVRLFLVIGVCVAVGGLAAACGGGSEGAATGGSASGGRGEQGGELHGPQGGAADGVVTSGGAHPGAGGASEGEGDSCEDAEYGAPCAEGFVCSGAVCSRSECGDGIVDSRTEQCDDANTVLADGCEPESCTFTCVSGEECDDANPCNGAESCNEEHLCLAGEPLSDGEPCGQDQVCRDGTECVEAGCGNAVLESGEHCDDGNATSDDGCELDCRFTCELTPGATQDWYADCDGDGYAKQGTKPKQQCLRPAPSACGGGYTLLAPSPSQVDCDDVHASALPGGKELCDGVDNDCNGVLDDVAAGTTYYRDMDTDGFGNPAVSRIGCSAPSGYVATAGDCDDSVKSIHPNAGEVCNSADDDCDSTIDQGLHVRRVDVSPQSVGCEVWQYGRDLGCEAKASAACAGVSPGGFCPMSAGFYIASGGTVTLGCLTPVLARQDIMRWELTARHSGCDGSAGEYNACQAAAHRYCGEHGHLTGYTFTTSASTYSLICVSSAQAELRSVSWADLDANDGAAEAYCAGPQRDGWWCARAVDSVCRSLGYATGFGPVEYNAGGTSLACVRSY